jgi:DNA-binding transcriptional regulator PaaX
MSEEVIVTPNQVLEAMRELVSNRGILSDMSAFTPEETEMRKKVVQKIDEAYMDLLGKFKAYNVSTTACTECEGGHHG